jgi:hypothetical protein
MDYVEELSKLKYNRRHGQARKQEPVFGKTHKSDLEIKQLSQAQAKQLYNYYVKLQNTDLNMQDAYAEHLPELTDEKVRVLAKVMTLKFSGAVGKPSKVYTKETEANKALVGNELIRLSYVDKQAFIPAEFAPPSKIAQLQDTIKSVPVAAVNKNKKILKQQEKLSQYVEQAFSEDKSYTPQQVDKIKSELIELNPRIKEQPFFHNLFKSIKVVQDDPRSNPLNIAGQESKILKVDGMATRQMMSQPINPQSSSSAENSMVFDADRGVRPVVNPEVSAPRIPFVTTTYKGGTAIDPLQSTNPIPQQPEEQKEPEPEKTEGGEIINNAPNVIKPTLAAAFQHEGKPQPKKVEFKKKSTYAPPSALNEEINKYISEAAEEGKTPPQQVIQDANAEVQRSDDKLIGDRYRVGIAPNQSRAAADIILKKKSQINKSINTFSNLNWVYSRANSQVGNASSLKKMSDFEDKQRYGQVYLPRARQPVSRMTEMHQNKKFLATLSDPLCPQSDANTRTMLKSSSTGSADLDDMDVVQPRTWVQPPNMAKSISSMDNKHAPKKVRLTNPISEMHNIRNTNRANKMVDNLLYPDIKTDNQTGDLIFA